MDTPDTRLVSLHAENGSPHARLSQALGSLEGADWGLLLCGEAGLARQLAALFGPGTLRVDSRLKVDRAIFASAGLAVATTEADWRGSRAVWLLEPDERDFKRAQRSGVSLIVDGTLHPGGQWFERSEGAALLVYHSGAVLSGFGDLSLSAVFGKGKAPVRAAPAPSDLHLAMALRDLATLSLRLAQSARTVTELASHLAGQAQVIGRQALLLAPDSAPDTLAPLGGVLAAAQNVQAGTVITPGVQSAKQVLALLRAGGLEVATDAPEENKESPEPALREQQNREQQGREGQGREQQRQFRPQPQERPREQQNREQQNRDQQNRNGQNREMPAREQRPERQAQTQPQPSQTQPSQAQPSQRPQTAPLGYTPEIVFSQSLAEHPATEGSAMLTQVTPVSSGPDESDVALSNPEVQSELQGELLAEPREAASQASERQHEQQYVRQQPQPRHQPQQRREQSQPERGQAHTQATQTQEPEINLPPDLPASTEALPELSSEQQQVYNRLRDWRNAEAKRLEISRFIIASNATLSAIAQRLPQSEAELREVRGMGPERMKKYAATILSLTTQR